MPCSICVDKEDAYCLDYGELSIAIVVLMRMTFLFLDVWALPLAAIPLIVGAFLRSSVCRQCTKASLAKAFVLLFIGVLLLVLAFHSYRMHVLHFSPMYKAEGLIERIFCFFFQGTLYSNKSTVALSLKALWILASTVSLAPLAKPRVSTVEESSTHAKVAVPGDIFLAVDPFAKYGLNKPLFMLPVDEDSLCEHSIEALAFAWLEEGDAVEVSVVLKDNGLSSRTMDVTCPSGTQAQPIIGRFIVRKGSSGSFESITFAGSYSGAQNAATHIPKEMTKTLNMSDFANDNCQAVVWVNVIHPEYKVCLFGQKNTNTNLNMRAASEYICIDATYAEIKASHADLRKNST